MGQPFNLLRGTMCLVALTAAPTLSGCGAADDITSALLQTSKPAAPAAEQPKPQPLDTRTEGERMAQAGDALVMEGRDLMAEGQARIAEGERMAAEGKRIQEEERAGHVSRDRRQARKAN